MTVTTRERIVDTRGPSICWIKAPGDPEWSLWWTAEAGSLEIVKDNNNQNFREIQRAGFVLLSDCEVTKVSREIPEQALFTQQSGYSAKGDLRIMAGGAGNSCITMPPSNMTYSDAVLLTKAYAKINSSAVMSGESLSDLGQTVGMLRRPFKSAGLLLGRMLKHRNLRLGKTAASAAKATANSWLEYRYGWKPLIMDIDTIVQASYKKLAHCGKRRLVARVGDAYACDLRGTWTDATSYVGTKTSGSKSYSRSSKVGVGVLYDIAPQTGKQALQAILGVRPRDIPATVWELVPYSFVVDWFVNVGDWIQAVTPVPGITILGHWVTRVESTRTEWVATFDPPSLNNWVGTIGPEVTTTYSYIRTCNQPIAPTPVWKLKPISRLHQIDGAALLLKPVLEGLRAMRH